MKYKILCISFIFLQTSCTQNFLSYIKTPQKKEILSLNNILTESGLINTPPPLKTKESTNMIYPTGILLTNKHLKLVQKVKTISVTNNSLITLSIDTKNFLIATPYFSSPHIIYQANHSAPHKGKFLFMVGEKNGIVKIRLYNTEGILIEEAVWYIEIIPSTQVNYDKN